jgi:hypothetical protein
VVRGCPAKPYLKADFCEANISPVDVLNAVKAAGEADEAKAYFVHVTEWEDAAPLPGGSATPQWQRLKRSEWAGFDYKGLPKQLRFERQPDPVQQSS